MNKYDKAKNRIDKEVDEAANELLGDFPVNMLSSTTALAGLLKVAILKGYDLGVSHVLSLRKDFE